jgi:hypothetical protein
MSHVLTDIRPAGVVAFGNRRTGEGAANKSDGEQQRAD